MTWEESDRSLLCLHLLVPHVASWLCPRASGSLVKDWDGWWSRREAQKEIQAGLLNFVSCPSQPSTPGFLWPADFFLLRDEEKTQGHTLVCHLTCVGGAWDGS